jgi:hypothetical protein
MNLFIPLCALATTLANAQSDWSWQRPTEQLGSFATDASPTLDGWLVSTSDWLGNANVLRPGHAIFLSPIGEFVTEHRLASQSFMGHAQFVLRDNSSEILIVGGAYTDALTWTSGLFQYAFNSSGEPVDSSFFKFEGFDEMYVENALLDASGQILWGAGGTVEGWPFSNRMTPLLTTVDGDSITSAIYGQGNQGAFCHQLGEWRGRSWLSVEGWTPGSISGFPRLITWNDTLGFDDGFGLQDLTGNTLVDLDSTVKASLDILELTEDHFATSGSVGNLSDRYITAVATYAYGGALMNRRLFSSGSSNNDYVAIHEALVKDVDGNLLFAISENAQLGPPSFYAPFEPNRLHVFKLDTSLNILCDLVVDGIAENTYYHLNRIKATEDGGYLLVGGRKDMSDPQTNRFEAWVRKFGPGDCFTSIAEHPQRKIAVVFPNPGRDGFTLTMEREASNGTVTIHDATGRQCGSIALKHGTAHFRAEQLEPGVYMYRVMDQGGNTLDTGRWIKQ